MLRALGATRRSGWARLLRELREEEVFVSREDLRELVLRVLFAVAEEAFFFAADAGVSLVPLNADRVPTGGSRQTRQRSKRIRRRDISENLRRCTALLEWAADIDTYDTTLRPRAASHTRRIAGRTSADTRHAHPYDAGPGQKSLSR